jgi:hypothetical protein
MLTVDNRHIVPLFAAGLGIVVNVPQRMLFVARQGGATGYPVAVGRPSWPTPLGSFSIATKETNPTWDVPQSIPGGSAQGGSITSVESAARSRQSAGCALDGIKRRRCGIHAPTPQAVSTRRRRTDVSACTRRTSRQCSLRWRSVCERASVSADSGCGRRRSRIREAHRDVYGRGPPTRWISFRCGRVSLASSIRVDWDLVAQVIEQRAGVARVVTR